MFDTKSDYALNKMDPEAIVCKSATGVHIRLTSEDFASTKEFEDWKKWSDGDYKKTESKGRNFYDHCIPLNETMDSTGLSIEEVLMEPLLAQEHQDFRMSRIQQVREALTDKQYRRLCLYYLQDMTEAEIAAVEGVGQQRISVSLTSGIKVLKKILKKF